MELGKSGIRSEMGTLWQPHPTQDQPAPQGGFGIDSRIGAAAPRAPAASREDSRPQAILKFHCPSSWDFRACHGVPVNLVGIFVVSWIFWISLFYVIQTSVCLMSQMRVLCANWGFLCVSFYLLGDFTELVNSIYVLFLLLSIHLIHKIGNVFTFYLLNLNILCQ